MLQCHKNLAQCFNLSNHFLALTLNFAQNGQNFFLFTLVFDLLSTLFLFCRHDPCKLENRFFDISEDVF